MTWMYSRGERHQTIGAPADIRVQRGDLAVMLMGVSPACVASKQEAELHHEAIDPLGVDGREVC